LAITAAFDFLNAPEEDPTRFGTASLSMTRGKVVLVPFPFDDLTTEKARPAVCLTEPVTSHRHIVLAFVTSRQAEEPLDTDVVLAPQDPDFAQTGLQVRSTIRIHRLLTVASSIIKRKLGTLPAGLQGPRR
jgi:mRNA interferase MazF